MVKALRLIRGQLGSEKIRSTSLISENVALKREVAKMEEVVVWTNSFYERLVKLDRLNRVNKQAADAVADQAATTAKAAADAQKHVAADPDAAAAAAAAAGEAAEAAAATKSPEAVRSTRHADLADLLAQLPLTFAEAQRRKTEFTAEAKRTRGQLEELHTHLSDCRGKLVDANLAKDTISMLKHGAEQMALVKKQDRLLSWLESHKIDLLQIQEDEEARATARGTFQALTPDSDRVGSDAGDQQRASAARELKDSVARIYRHILNREFVLTGTPNLALDTTASGTSPASLLCTETPHDEGGTPTSTACTIM
jgi:hypothetical protein